jgi:hypothetical protein
MSPNRASTGNWGKASLCFGVGDVASDADGIDADEVRRAHLARGQCASRPVKFALPLRPSTDARLSPERSERANAEEGRRAR